MPTPLDDVAFLARSPHRVQVLRTLASGSRTRPTLHRETGISQPTLGRVLGALEERTWVEKRDGSYALTPWGELLVDQFDDLLETVETIQHVGHVVTRLPTDEMGFDLRRFGSATITTPRTGDLLRHVRRAEEVLGEARRLRVLADTIMPRALEDQRDRVANAPGDDRLIESVITGDAIERALANETLVGFIGDFLESGRAPVYRYDGTIPMTFAIADDVAMLAPTDEQGMPGALVETDDEVIRAWLDDRFDDYVEQSTALTVEDLPQ